MGGIPKSVPGRQQLVDIYCGASYDLVSLPVPEADILAHQLFPLRMYANFINPPIE
jgi:hypothetical protein